MSPLLPLQSVLTGAGFAPDGESGPPTFTRTLALYSPVLGDEARLTVRVYTSGRRISVRGWAEHPEYKRYVDRQRVWGLTSDGQGKLSFSIEAPSPAELQRLVQTLLHVAHRLPSCGDDPYRISPGLPYADELGAVRDLFMGVEAVDGNRYASPVKALLDELFPVLALCSQRSPADPATVARKQIDRAVELLLHTKAQLR